MPNQKSSNSKFNVASEIFKVGQDKTKNNDTNTLTDKNLDSIDEGEIVVENTESKKIRLKSSTILHDSSQKNSCNNKIENTCGTQKSDKICRQSNSASQTQILREAKSNKVDGSINGSKYCRIFNCMSSHNENHQIHDSESTDEFKNRFSSYYIRAAKNKTMADSRDVDVKEGISEKLNESSDTKHLNGGVVRLIITNFKEITKEKPDKTPEISVFSEKAQQDVNLSMNNSSLDCGLECDLERRKMCSGNARSPESNKSVCLSNKMQSASEIIKQSGSDVSTSHGIQETNRDKDDGRGGLAKISLESLDDDPYDELQEYLENIKREINEAFEKHQQRNNEIQIYDNIDSMMGSVKSSPGHILPQTINNSSEEGDEHSNSNSSTRGTPDFKKREPTVEHQNSQDSCDVNLWAHNILKELDNLMGPSKDDCSRNDSLKMSQTRNILKPEKHATIPLQSFNLNVSTTESKFSQPKKLTLAKNPKTSPLFSNKKLPIGEDVPKHSLSVLKIEENSKNRTDLDVELLVNKSSSTKKETDKQNILLLNEVSKKGSTSTIWTSEESLLRSAGTIDEDNKSSSSSTCEERSNAFSCGKSGNSLESSEVDSERNETAEDSNKEEKFRSPAFRDENFDIYNEAAYISSDGKVIDDPDLLEVLSLCDEVNYEDDDDSTYVKNVMEDDEIILRNKPKIGSFYSGPNQSQRNRKSRRFSIPQSKLPEFTPDPYDRRSKANRPKYLPFTQEPFRSVNNSNIRELPSPSSASLNSGTENMIIQELTTKSNSVPILIKKDTISDVFAGHNNTLRYSRSQSDRYLAEIEAVEACKWLRAAGFPQYAQMYEDHQFPIDLSSVAKDHPLLENDPLQSLYRRLCTLNRCATMHIDSARKHSHQPKDDSDDEGIALSENWMFQPQIRRWSRIGEAGLEIPTKHLQDKAEGSSKGSSPDRFEDDLHIPANLAFSTLPVPSDGNTSDSESNMNRLRRSGSERFKDGAKALLRRVESIKTSRRKRQNRAGLVISGPQVLDLNKLNPKDMKSAKVTFSNPPSPSPTSPVHSYPRSPLFGNELKIPSETDKYLHPNRLSPKKILPGPRSARSTQASPLHFFAHPMPHLIEGKSDDSSSYCSDSQDSNCGHVPTHRQGSRSRRFLQRKGKVDDIGIHSDSECHQPSGIKMVYEDTNSNNVEIKVKKLVRGGSLKLSNDSKKARGSFQSRSFRSRSSVRKSRLSSESDKEDNKLSKSPVVRWHSFREKDHLTVISKKPGGEGTSFAAMSCGQLQIIRKLALVTLTGYMERYCPSHRSGWNWELPKFIKKIKTPDYKDKKVFGIPFLLVLQRTGYSLPFAIRAALRWLRRNAFDQVGLFRKSSVKSRVTKLKELIECCEDDSMEIYDAHQAYDVADMLKQYFRELPDSLLTSKMSETFVGIFQHLPAEVRAEAVQAAVLLLPDENREVLYCLLDFLHEIAAHSQLNQMSANNLAVCWAPSVFSNSIALGRTTAVSPRRRKVAGVPDVKELSEIKASNECLTFMISNYKEVFTVSHEKMKHCNFGYMEESKPVPLEALGEGMQFQNWRGYLYECTSATIKEGREKTRGWESVVSLDQNVEIAFKKVGDGHPLRLWRCTTEVEAPPIEVLDYILKERNLWDINLVKSRTVQRLDDRNEIFQYTCDGQILTDYCVLRSWQSELPKGACVIVETSVEHQNAPIMQGAVRGVVLASRFLIEPCGSGRSRVMHLARVDTKGRTPEFYNKCYGHLCSHYLAKIRTAFRHVAEGPESKV